MAQNKTGTALAPLLALVMIIILATVIISTLNTKKKAAAESSDGFAEGETITLSPFRKQQASSQDPAEGGGITLNVPALLLSAIADCDHGNFALAEDKLRTVLVFAPETPVALSYLGTLLYNRKKFKQAEYFFRRLTKCSPEDYSVHIRMGQTLVQRNDFEGALTEAQKAFSLSPDNGDVILNLARISALSGNKEKAMYYINRAIENPSPNLVPFLFDPAFDTLRDAPAYQELISILLGAK